MYFGKWRLFMAVLNHFPLTTLCPFYYFIMVMSHEVHAVVWKTRSFLQDISNITTVFLCFQKHELFPDIIIVFVSKILLGKKNITIILSKM